MVLTQICWHIYVFAFVTCSLFAGENAKPAATSIPLHQQSPAYQALLARERDFAPPTM